MPDQHPWISDEGVVLLRKVERVIATDPNSYNQGTFCGTAMCLAGHGAFLSGAADQTTYDNKDGWPCKDGRVAFKPGELDWFDFGQRVFGIDTIRRAIDLFCHGQSWPGPFGPDFQNARTTEARVCVAIRRIEHFIATGE